MKMTTNRLEAFSDAVIAIVITIMVLELKAPEDASFEALESLLSVFISYVVSFVYLGIYWNNHHHLFHVSEQVDGKILWANLHLLFWLSLIPFTTSWMGEHHFGAAPMAVYGFVLLMSAFAFTLLQYAIIHAHKNECTFTRRKGTSIKVLISIFFYFAGISLSFYNHVFAMLCYIVVAVIWLVPDKQLEEQSSAKSILPTKSDAKQAE